MILEAWQILASLTPNYAALALFGLGLVFGSFGYATYLRVGSGESIMAPRSSCPNCGHHLGATELVPVLSYLWLRGRCRLCRLPIPVTYPLAEIGFGLAAAAAGYSAGWAGGAVTLALAVVGAIVAGLWRRRRVLPRGSPGLTIVENLVALGIIAAAAAPVLNLLVGSVDALQLTEGRSVEVNLARAKVQQLANVGLLSGLAPLESQNGTSELSTDGRYTVTTEVAADPDATGKAWKDNVRRVTVRVKCSACTWRWGASNPEVVITSFVRVK